MKSIQLFIIWFIIITSFCQYAIGKDPDTQQVYRANTVINHLKLKKVIGDNAEFSIVVPEHGSFTDTIIFIEDRGKKLALKIYLSDTSSREMFEGDKAHANTVKKYKDLIEKIEMNQEVKLPLLIEQIEFGESDSIQYLLMERALGISFKALANMVPSMDEPRISRIFQAIGEQQANLEVFTFQDNKALGLADSHPDNVFFDENSLRMSLIDLGSFDYQDLRSFHYQGTYRSALNEFTGSADLASRINLATSNEEVDAALDNLKKFLLAKKSTYIGYISVLKKQNQNAEVAKQGFNEDLKLLLMLTLRKITNEYGKTRLAEIVRELQL